MSMPTRPPHDGTVSNQKTFVAAIQNLQNTGPQNLYTANGTPFTAQVHLTHSGKHRGQDCIKVNGRGKKGDYSIYIYSCCWGHETNCSRSYIKMYTPIL